MRTCLAMTHEYSVMRVETGPLNQQEQSTSMHYFWPRHDKACRHAVVEAGANGEPAGLEVNRTMLNLKILCNLVMLMGTSQQLKETYWQA